MAKRHKNQWNDECLSDNFQLELITAVWIIIIFFFHILSLCNFQDICRNDRTNKRTKEKTNEHEMKWNEMK